MGNAFDCMPKKELRGDIGSRSKRSAKSRSQKKMSTSEEELLHRQALAMAIQQHQLSQRFEGSMSRRIGSTSSRRRDLPDSITSGKLCRRGTILLLLGSSQDTILRVGKIPLEYSLDLFLLVPHAAWKNPVFLENLEAKKIILIHGEGFGAWCWYKTISLLEEAGICPVALDLRGSGIDYTDPNSITTLADYSKPLIDYLHNLPDDEKVILVGHSCGGASISYAMESYPKKISKAVFVSATMVSDGQKPFDVLSEELASADVFLKESQFLVYGNGKDKLPTGLMFDKQQIKGLYFSQSPHKDIALASVSMKPIPLAPMMEKLALTPENYGSVRRFFVQTLDDHMLSPDIQEKLVRENPPQGIYKIKGSDHCPFFSKPQSLHKILLEIAQLP